MRALTTFREDVREDFKQMHLKIDSFSFVSQDLYTAERNDLERRVGTLETSLVWGVRLVLGLVLTAVIGGVLIV